LLWFCFLLILLFFSLHTKLHILIFIRNQIFLWAALFASLLLFQCAIFYTKKSYMLAGLRNKCEDFAS
jgi:hypothetical protein